MSTNYEAIRAKHKEWYGTRLKKFARRYFVEPYADRTHFILELLQNAEDALKLKTKSHPNNGTISFKLDAEKLWVSHFGKPFDEQDVSAICAISEGTKEQELTAIGRFGIGFKSVYAVTQRPEIHSGEENFTIEDYVFPVPTPPIERRRGETIFILPINRNRAIYEEIQNGLARLPATTLLFLREINEISWRTSKGKSGTYRRIEEPISTNIRRVTLNSEEKYNSQTWLVLSENLEHKNKEAGFIEIAFHLDNDSKNQFHLQCIPESPLVVFFPTVIETRLGFLVQGPYRTTLSRESVPFDDTWNRRLINKTGTLLIKGLRWLRDKNDLDPSILECLPLDAELFGEGKPFAPFFDKVQKALGEEPLLPKYDGGYISAKQAKLARSQELRELFSEKHLKKIYGSNVNWLDKTITRDLTPDLFNYLTNILEVEEVTPNSIVLKLEREFLERQSNEWMSRLYEYLDDIKIDVQNLPIIRLDDSTHTAPLEDSKPLAFLPGETKTNFPTVHRDVCATNKARHFLEEIGLTTPDLVDDVITNILPKYASQEIRVGKANYQKDLRSILKAFKTDSKAKREQLIQSLRNNYFIMAVDAGDEAKTAAKPEMVYQATHELKELFDGVNEILLVDNDYFEGIDASELLEICGTLPYLKPVDAKLAYEKRMAIRNELDVERAYDVGNTTNYYDLYGLDRVLEILPKLRPRRLRMKAEMIWKSLLVLQSKRNDAFSASYGVTYYNRYHSKSIDPLFVDKLNDVAWVPKGGRLKKPGQVDFDSLGWEKNNFLLAKIHFRPPEIDVFAEKYGIDPEAIHLIKERGITAGELRYLLASKEEPREKVKQDQSLEPFEDHSEELAPAAVREPHATAVEGSRSEVREFVSYVKVSVEELNASDTETYEERIELEDKAIQYVQNLEPNLLRAPKNNEGYDLIEESDGSILRWVEVKAMRTGWDNRPITLSRPQFEFATKWEEKYSIYVVEYAGDPTKTHVLEVKNPVGKSRSYTFDSGWRVIAESKY
jgi:hypothetical protein